MAANNQTMIIAAAGIGMIGLALLLRPKTPKPPMAARNLQVGYRRQ